ncbi:MAG: 50S ribosomal protein L24 [candidate division TM6 bacterium GW2011_GWE2_42_60]|nr:MAG: 50S ribosomal protein L24 [candidate division TM6 bacterium GW2011_GWE2_42_60]HBY05566.1 50S ribosomal protein L24 [Candidatus Dependentiae bacterium]
MHVKKNDMVLVIAGNDKGKKGAVIDILPEKGKIKVQNVAIATRHKNKSSRSGGAKPGITKQERWIDSSNVKKI